MSTSELTPTAQPRTGLAAASMGGAEVLAQSVAGIAPSAVMATGPALVAIGAGDAILYSYLASTVILLMVGWCIAQFTRSHGGGTLLSHITSAFGPGAGFLGAVGLVFGYAFIAISSIAGFTIYATPLLELAGVPGTASTAVAVLLEVLVAVLAAYAMIRGVQLSTRVGVALELVSITAILVVVVAVLVKFGLPSAPLHPAGLGVDGITGGMVLAILGYVGFESAACMSTEAREPQRTVPRAVLGSALIAAVLYLISAYAQLVGFGSGDAITASSAPLNDLADTGGVHPLGYLVDLGAAASFFACVTGSLNAASRLVFAMGDTPLLHRSLAVAHPIRQTPHLAIGLLSGLCGLIAVVMTVSGVEVVNVFAYAGTIGTYGYMVAYILISLGIAVHLRRTASPIGAAVVVGGLAALGMLYVLFRNVYPVPAAPYSALPWIFLAVLVGAALWYAVVRSRGWVVDVAAAERAEAQAESRDS